MVLSFFQGRRRIVTSSDTMQLSTNVGSKNCAKSEMAVMLLWLIEKGSVRFGSQACGVLGSFFGCAEIFTMSQSHDSRII